MSNLESKWGKTLTEKTARGIMTDLTEPTADGRHPKYRHLILFEVEDHHGSLILTAAGQKGDALISTEDWEHMVDGDRDAIQNDFAWLSDEYLAQLR